MKMYKLFSIIFLMSVVFFACSNSSSDSSQNDVVIHENEVQNQTTVANDNSTDPRTDASTTIKQNDGPGLNLWIADQDVKPGEEFCTQVFASEYDGLLSMQYSIRWNPEILEFKEVSGYQLTYFDQNDVGTTRVKEGILTVVWIDDSLKGQDLKKDDVLYELCFVVKGAAGTDTPIRFWTSPTPYEVVNRAEKVQPFSPHKGVITIK